MKNIPNKKISKSQLFKINIINLLFVFYVFFDLIRLFSNELKYIADIGYILVGISSIIVTIVLKGINKQIRLLLFIFIYIIAGLLGSIINQNIEIQEAMWPLGFMGMAMLILNFNINKKIVKLVFYFIAFYLLGSILLNGIDNYQLSSSRNSISIIMLFYFSLLIIHLVKEKQGISYFPILLSLLVVTIAIGRSGIFTFLIISFVFIFINRSTYPYNIKINSKFLITITIISLALLFGIDRLPELFPMAYSNFQENGLESSRTFIWKDYISASMSSIKNVLFGTPIEGTFFLDLYSNNLHNSFLMLHAKYGLVIVLLVIALIIRAVIHFIKTQNSVLLIILISVLFRMQFDYTNFNAQLDVILIYLVFHKYYEKG